MAIVRLSAVRREIGDVVILDSLSASIAAGDRIGLVGANGAGKTTLLSMIAGRLEPDAGGVSRRRGLSVGLLAQEANLDPEFARAPTLRAAVRAGARELERIEARLAELEAAGAGGVESAEYARLRDDFEGRAGYELDVRVDAALSGLGFDRRRWSAPPAQLSGGEQTRAALARLLIADDELLLLDEPTNHLDVAAIEWLETVLGRRTGALVVASHDRAFLDATVERVWELRERRLTAFRGNYARYVAQRQQRDERSAREAEAHTRRIERERELVQRYRSQRKHTKMHEHERRLEALEQAPPEGPRREQRLALDPSAAGRRSRAVHRTAQVALSVDGLACGYGGRPIVRTDRLEAAGGERVGIVGPNGAGKTTLLRTLAGEIAPLGGRIELGHAVTPAYLAQVRRTPPRGTTVLETLALATGLDAGPARSHLARFLFRGDEVAKPVAELSGGERSRLDLAILGAAGANLLLLDEPTNHLDIPARESLEAFLREVAATVLLVSHDRRLLETVCNRLWVVAADDGQPGRVAPFDGSYRDWRAAVGAGWTLDVELARRAGARPTTAAVSPGRADHPPRRRPASGGGGRPAGRRPALSKDAYRRRRELVEADLTRLGLRKSQLELALADPQVQANYVELRRISSELADVDSALAQVEDAWLVLAEQAPR